MPRLNRPIQVGQYKNLTERQLEITALVSQGLSNKHIAQNLGITEGTVKVHIHEILGRLQLVNRTALAAFYWKIGYETSKQTGTFSPSS